MLSVDGWRSKEWISTALLGLAVWAGLDAQFAGTDGVKPRISRLLLSAVATIGSVACEFLL